MEKETNTQKARRALADQGQVCCCMNPIPEPGSCCGTIMNRNLTVSYYGKRCARCKQIILATVR